MTRLPPFFLFVAALSVALGCRNDATTRLEGTSNSLSNSEKYERVVAMFSNYANDFPGVPALTPEDAKQLLASGTAILVDVRTPAERSVSMIPGAIATDDYERRAAEFDGKRVITYCTIGYRSGLYARKLRERGVDAANLAGSILAWAHAGGEFVDPSGKPTRKLHIYGAEWDLAPDNYEPVY
jgi:sodium/bile acid cotransporter 7